jgi:hypothetical protein
VGAVAGSGKGRRNSRKTQDRRWRVQQLDRLILREFLESVGAECAAGASGHDIASFEEKSGLSLPDNVRDVWTASNGMVIKNGLRRMKLMALSECLEALQGMKQYGIPQTWGFFPFTDTNDSNPYCICCNEPVRGYIARVFHDDTSKIAFRDLGAFLDAIQCVCSASGESGPSLHYLPEDFSRNQPKRTDGDMRTGLALLELVDQLEGEIEQADARRWAITLLAEVQVAEIIRLLDSGDEYCRREAISRLESMKTPKANEAIKRHKREFGDFMKKCTAELRAAGLDVAEVKSESIRLGPGITWLNMPMFFSRRQSPTFFGDFVKRAKELVAMKKKK